METQHQNASTLSANEVGMLISEKSKIQTLVSIFGVNGNIPSYNKALLTESLAALALRKARR